MNDDQFRTLMLDLAAAEEPAMKAPLKRTKDCEPIPLFDPEFRRCTGKKLNWDHVSICPYCQMTMRAVARVFIKKVRKPQPVGWQRSCAAADPFLYEQEFHLPPENGLTINGHLQFFRDEGERRDAWKAKLVFPRADNGATGDETGVLPELAKFDQAVIVLKVSEADGKDRTVPVSVKLVQSGDLVSSRLPLELEGPLKEKYQFRIEQVRHAPPLPDACSDERTRTRRGDRHRNGCRAGFAVVSSGLRLGGTAPSSL